MPEYLHPGVYVQEESSGAKPIEGASTSTACFVGETARGRPDRPTFVSSWSQFERAFGSFNKKYQLPLSVYQFFQNGGRRAYILRVLPHVLKDETGTVIKEGAKEASGKLAIPGAEISISAQGGGEWANGLKVTVAKNQFNSKLYDWTVAQPSADGVSFEELEKFGGVGAAESGERFYASLINRDSNYIRIEPDAKGGFPEWSALEKSVEVQLGGGTDGPTPAAAAGQPASAAAPPTESDYDQSLQSLNRIDDASILVIPGASKEVMAKGIAYVEGRRLGDMIYIIDSIGSARDNRSSELQIAEVKALQKEIATKSSYAALYFPWVKVADPYSQVSGATIYTPPSGMIAGLYARTDNTRGVWKAPAGTEAGLLGAVGVAASVTDSDQDTLNPIGINCIRQFPASGIVVWGARTLATESNPEYRYVPIRRMAMFLKTSLFRGTQWVVFEPNDEPLWSAIRFNINAFMLTQFRSGAFQGGKPSEAFFVKCDEDNNIQATIDAGQVHILVAFAPLKPAEFVIIHITQVRKE